MINFPERLRSARKAKGWSLQELASQVGNISKQALGKYEQGLMKPESDTLFALTQALGLNPSYFLKPARRSILPCRPKTKRARMLKAAT